ncbi:MAG: AraC family transcriptional regulator [Anaerolineaceae bacterium]|nr:AraC family transcriptional regulator [Anaerolineaceae bacterium]
MDFSLFDEVRSADSPFVERIWYARSEQGRDFTSVAETHSEIVIVRYQGKTEVVVRGPETKATPATTLADSECFGIVLKLGTFIPILLPKNLTDRREAFLPIASHQSFWLDNTAWEIPTFDNADTFVQQLVREGLLLHDPVVSAVLQGQPQAFSPRALQYRFVRATGLPHKVIQQIERARRAASLLESGMSILDSAHETGYYDQSHLTNSLSRFLGQTPAQIAQVGQLIPQP